MYKVVKRDGDVVDFDLTKIGNAIKKAFDSVGKNYTDEIIDFLVLKVTADFSSKVNIETGILASGFKYDTIDVESVQDSVEKVLIKSGYDDVAKSFIIYRQQHNKIRHAGDTLIDYRVVMEKYLKRSDWRVKENSTVDYSIGGQILSVNGAITANYWLTEIYDTEIAAAHRNAEIHIHDLAMLAGYCCGHDLKQLIRLGLGGVPGKTTSAPASHLPSLCNQMVNFLGIMQNEWAGAQAFSSFDTLLAPFVKVDNLPYDKVKKAIESFIYGVNTPSRWGTQSPFSNITLDWVIPDDLRDEKAIIGGKEADFTYGDCVAEQAMVNKAFLEIMLEGDAEGRGFQYPIPTYSITKDFDWSDTENNRLLFGMAAKYGTPYFSNYVNSDMKPSDIRAMCCRLRLDLREIQKKKGGGYFGSGSRTGSVGVVTINLPRIAYLSVDEADWFKRLDRIMDISARSLNIKREVINKLMNDKFFPYMHRYIDSLDTFFSTIGIIGFNEAGLNARWLQAGMESEDTRSFAVKTLNHMLQRLPMYQEKYKSMFNLEATPAESTCYRLAKHDKELYPDIKTAPSKYDAAPYYTNSTHLPVNFTGNLFEALKVQDPLQTLYTSGTVFHAFLGQRLQDWKSAADIVRKVCENFKLPYFTLSPVYSICPNHGYINGEVWKCPTCGTETEVNSRITGYYRPVKNWNDGKLHEFKERTPYDVAQALAANIAPAIVEEVQGIISEPTTESTSDMNDGIFMFVSKTCPKCRIAERMIENNPIPFVIDQLYAEDNPALVESLGLMSAPSIVVIENHKVEEKYQGFEEVSKYIKDNSLVLN